MLTKINSASMFEAVKDVYISSFPEEERRPWADLLGAISGGNIAAYLIEDAGKVCGFITTWRLQGAVYIEHFAVSADVRGRGFGAKSLAELSEIVGSPLVLEVEPPQTGSMAERRIAFYERCGFRAHHSFDYCQPPYAPGLPWVPLVLMTKGDADPALLAPQLHSKVYKVK